MNVSENDVKVLGKVVSIAVDNIVADAELVFDKNANLNQETINRNMTNAINQAVADVSSINTRVGSLEDAIDDKLNISDYQTYASLMRESIMFKISEVEEEKQDILTFDNIPTQGSNNPVKSGGIKSAIDEHTENSAIHVTAQDKQNINLVNRVYSDIDPDTGNFRIFNTTSNPPMIFAKFSVVLTPSAGGAYYTQESSYGNPPHYLLLSGVEKHQGAPGNGTLWQVVIDMQGKRYYRSISLDDNPINWNTDFLPQNN